MNDIDIIIDLFKKNQYNLKLDKDFSYYEDMLINIANEYDILELKLREAEEELEEIKQQVRIRYQDRMRIYE